MWNRLTYPAAVALLVAFAACGTGDPVATEIPPDGAPIAITKWLVAGPFPSATLETAVPDSVAREGYDADYLASLGGEAAARPQPGTTVATGRYDPWRSSRTGGKATTLIWWTSTANRQTSAPICMPNS